MSITVKQPKFFLDAVAGSPATYTDIAALAGGGYVATWVEGTDVRYQRFDAAGVAVGGFGQIADGANTPSGNPAITALPDGGFAIAWTMDSTSADSLIRVQRYSANGSVNGAPIVVSTNGSARPEVPVQLAATADGRIGVVYTHDAAPASPLAAGDVRFRIIETDGTVGADIVVDISTDDAGNAFIDAVGNNFHITYAQKTLFGSSTLGKQAVYSSAGALVTPVASVSDQQVGDAFQHVTTLAGGQQLVVWNDLDSISARLFSDSLTPAGAEFKLAGLTAVVLDKLDIVALPGGGFAVLATDRIAVYDSTGKLAAPAFMLGETVDSSSGSIDVTADGHLVVAYSAAGVAQTLMLDPAGTLARSDVDGDGDSDIVMFSQTSGTVSRFDMENGVMLSTTPALVQTGTSGNWDVQAIGDFTGNRTGDLVEKNASTGAFRIHTLVAGEFRSEASLGTIGTDWDVRSTGDFNADGIADILWRNSTSGQVYVWTMNASLQQTGGTSIGTFGTEWNAVAAPDLDGDGDGDILLRNDTNGRLYVFEMQNGAVVTGHSLPTFGTEWTVASTGDYNGDGNGDVALKNTATGQFYLLQFSDQFDYFGSDLGIVGTDWNIAASGDYNRDGTDDIAWRNAANNDVFIWRMDNGHQAATGSSGIGFVSSDLVIV